mmetsp:Transcript_19663/g.51151  ORF Transcript_19663/g.51151 Transcript_19663/m.51151 type:complete len:272 (-) Transcript_19663:49-864(-)
MAARDPIARLGERSQARGRGNYREAYLKVETRHGEQQWEVTLTDTETGLAASGGVEQSKKRSEKLAASRLLELLGGGVAEPGEAEGLGAPAAALDGPDPVSLLGIRAQACGRGNYQEAYTKTATKHGEQRWEVVIQDNETRKSASGGVHQTKKASERQAAERLLALLEAAGSGAVSSVNSDAVVGDKVLALCLVHRLRERGISTPGKVQDIVSARLSNEALHRNAPRVGIAQRHAVHHTASLVEQYAFKVFTDQGHHIGRTTARLAPLLDD